MFDFLNKKILDHNTQKQVVKCPKCNANIVEHGEYWSCQNILSKSCDFSIKNTLNGEKIDIKYLLNFKAMEGLSDIYNEIESKSKEQLALRKYFGSNNVRRAKGCCRNCAHSLYRVDNTIRCAGENCNFSIDAVYKGVTFSDSQMVDLFDRRMSEEYEFTEADGRKVKGRVIILEDKDYYLLPEYLFFEDPSHLEEKYLNRYYLPTSRNFNHVPIKESLKYKKIKN